MKTEKNAEAKSNTLHSNKAYLVRAYYQWIIDNHMTPIIFIDDTSLDLDHEGIVFKTRKQDRFNISPQAIRNLVIDDEVMKFICSFDGKPQNMFFPMRAIIAVYAEETTQGALFENDIADEHIYENLTSHYLLNIENEIQFSKKSLPKDTIVQKYKKYFLVAKQEEIDTMPTIYKQAWAVRIFANVNYIDSSEKSIHLEFSANKYIALLKAKKWIDGLRGRDTSITQREQYKKRNTYIAGVLSEADKYNIQILSHIPHSEISILLEIINEYLFKKPCALFQGGERTDALFHCYGFWREHADVYDLYHEYYFLTNNVRDHIIKAIKKFRRFLYMMYKSDIERTAHEARIIKKCRHILRVAIIDDDRLKKLLADAIDDFFTDNPYGFKRPWPSQHSLYIDTSQKK